MGKRRRSSARNSSTNHNNKTTATPSSSDNMPCSSGTELLSREKSSRLTELKPPSPGMDVSDGTAKLLNVHSPLSHQHYNLSRSMFLKRSRHHYSHQYSRRNSGNHGNASSSHEKTGPSNSERLPFKLTRLPLKQLVSDSGCQIENREKPFNRAERIRFGSSVVDAVSSDAVKMICGICQKMLRRKPYFLGESLSSGEHSVVAVLVCGHIYHADCLEQKTSVEHICDPPCPSCLNLLSPTETSAAQQ
ncbi:hypothetical protein K2173_017785 [Erythroxylum novogranatense]|uniref:RING-type domain-containing protein n=1 Tax=Erythroxylum novogranatense TaxID=1862640 RepID=A0AAV8SMG0_9ROSI|nr:hypothetical protein K2173_017785 [Erythroxylum novogranatense]